jgi:hypothetical protein
MTTAEVGAYLAAERTCRVATCGPGGPHLTPLWFLWDGGALWLTSIVRSQRWADLARDPRVAVLVDGGEEYGELHGVELRGRVDQVGEVPRTGQPGQPGEPDDGLAEVERRFARKYFGQDEMIHDGRHAWLRLVPEQVTSWDFRKLDALPGR